MGAAAVAALARAGPAPYRWSAGARRSEWKQPCPGRGRAQRAIQSPYRSIAALAWPGVGRRPIPWCD